MRNALIGLLLLSANILAAQTYTVNTTADSGPGSLRDAIQQANAGSYDRVEFDVSPASTATDTIFLNSDLPPVLVKLEIDGTTESGYSTFNKPRIILKAADPSCNRGFTIVVSSGSVVKGVGIYNFPIGILLEQRKSVFDGVYVGNATSNYIVFSNNPDSCRVVNCVFGLDGNGNAAGSQQHALNLAGQNNVIGGQGNENIIANTANGFGLILSNFTGSCYENDFRNINPPTGANFLVYSNSSVTAPVPQYTVAAGTINVTGTNVAGDSIYLLVSSAVGSAGPTIYKTQANAAGQWSFNIPEPANNNLHAYLGRQDASGNYSSFTKQYTFGRFYDTLVVTNTSSDPNVVGSFNWTLNTAMALDGYHRILFDPSITLSTPINIPSTIYSAGMTNTRSILIDGDNRVKFDITATSYGLVLNHYVGDIDIKGIYFDLKGVVMVGMMVVDQSPGNRTLVDSCNFFNGQQGLWSTYGGSTITNCHFWDLTQCIVSTTSFVVGDSIVNCEFGVRYLPYMGGQQGIDIAIITKGTKGTYIGNNSFSNTGKVITSQTIAMAEGSYHFRIENNTFESITGYAIATGSHHSGIFYEPYAGGTINDNFVNGISNRAFVLAGLDTTYVYRNRVTCSDSTAFQLYLSKKVKLSENTFSSQHALGISLRNDPSNPSFVTNNNKNSPVITSFTGSTLSGTTDAGDSVEVYLADAGSSSSAVKFLGKVHAPGGTWSLPIPLQWQGGSYVAIATDVNGNSSELSNAFAVAGQKNIYVVRTAADTGCYCLREAIDAVNNGTANTINFDINSGSIIKVPTKLPPITNSVTIDATSQPGYTYGTPGIVFQYDSVNYSFGPGCSPFQSVAYTGLEIDANNVVIKGLGIDGFKRALYLKSGTSNHIVKYCSFTRTHVQNTVDLWSSNTLLDSCFFTGNRVNATSQGCPPGSISAVEQSLLNIQGDNNIVTNNSFSDNFARYQIRIENSNHLNLQHNDIDFNETRYTLGRFYVIFARQSSDISIDSNTITPAIPTMPVVGVHADTVNNINITYNTFDRASDAVQFELVTNSQIKLNNFKGYTAPAWLNRGVDMSECNHIVIDSNLFTGNNTMGEVIRINASSLITQRSDSIWVRDNEIGGYEHGIEMLWGGTSYVEIRRNTIRSTFTIPIRIGMPTIQNDGITPPVVTQQIQSNSLVLSGVSTPGFLVELFKGGYFGTRYDVSDYLGNAVADAAGNWTFTVPPSYYSALEDQSYMATVTGLKRNTSELSAPIIVNGSICSAMAVNYRHWNGNDTTACPNDTITLNVPLPAGSTVSWTGPNSLSSVTSSIKATEIGKYVVQVTDATATCTWKDSINVDYKLGASIPDFLIANQAGPGETLIAIEITFPLVDSSSWNFYGAPFQHVGSYYHVTYANAGTYQVTMRSHLGTCYQDVTKTVTIDPAYAHQSQVVSPGANDFQSVIVKPNPTDGRFDLEIVLNSQKTVTVEWVNAGNQTVDKTWKYSGDDHYDQYIDLAPLPNGVYLLRAYTDNDVRIIKVVVQ